jgi:hypothetical protein
MPTTMNPRAARYAAWMRSTRGGQSAQPVARTFEPGDTVGPVLAGEPTLTDEHRSDLFDLFHAVPSTSELAGHLNSLNLPPNLKRKLLEEKNKTVEASAPVLNPVDRTDATIHHLAQMDPATRTLAEKNPRLLAAFIAAHQGAANEQT